MDCLSLFLSKFQIEIMGKYGLLNYYFSRLFLNVMSVLY